MRRHEVRLVESSLERTARLLAADHGVRVVFRPGQAMTNGKQIILPTIPDDASQDLLDAMQGYLNHEVAHVIHTDFDVFVRLQKEKNLQLATNFVEDIRIERLFEKQYPGSKYNFHNLTAVLYARIREHWEHFNPFFQILASTYLQARHPDSNFYKEVLTDEQRETVQKVIQIIEDHKPLASTTDAEDCAKKILDFLKPPEPPPEEEQEEEEPQQGQGLMDVLTVMLKGKPGDEDGAGEGDAQPLPAGNGATGMSAMDMAGDLLVQVITDQYKHDQEAKAQYIPYDKSKDVYTKSPDRWNPKELDRLREQAADYTSVMRYKLMATLKSLMRSRWSGGKEHGHLDSRRLHKVATGTMHVYKQKVETAKLDTAVMLMIDHSGSMAGQRLQLAAESALVMGDVLHQLNVPFAVAGFSTEHPVDSPRDYGIYSRWNRLWICKHVDWNENWPTAAHKLTSLLPKANTLDGESLRWGAQQLLARPEKRKVLFWFNDGFPEPGAGDTGTCQKYLKDVVESCRQAGIEVIAFGIQSEAVKYYFPKHVVINKLEDLVREPLNHLDRILREGMK